MRKPALFIDQIHSNSAADQCLCFPYIDSTISTNFLNLKFQASSSHHLWLYSLVFVGLGRETPKPGFLSAAQTLSVLLFNHFQILI